jgi:hypothetical protein
MKSTGVGKNGEKGDGAFGMWNWECGIKKRC